MMINRKYSHTQKVNLDLSNADLRGKSFVGQKLSGIDFSGADIRGTNFSHAILTNTDFSNVNAGMNSLSMIRFRILMFLLSGLLGYGSGITGIIILDAVSRNPDSYIIHILLMSLTLLSLFLSVISQGFTASIVAILGIIAALTIVSGIIIFFIHGAEGFSELTQAAWNASAIGAWSIAGTFAGASAIFLTSFETKIWIVNKLNIAFWLTGVMGSILVYGSDYYGEERTSLFLSYLCLLIFTSISISWLGYYTGQKMIGESENFVAARSMIIEFISLGGTNFSGANLSSSNFSNSNLRGVNFRDSILINTCFWNAVGLDIAHSPNSYLIIKKVRRLLTLGDGEKQCFDNLNLSGCYLKGANLTEASFVSANLNHTNLQDANLYEANLRQTQLDAADFSGACLTGAVIEDWGITGETRLDNVNCQYIYMHDNLGKQGDSLRKPDNKDEIFSEGDFTEFIKPIVDTLDLYHKEDFDPRAVTSSFRKLVASNPEANLEIVAMEKRGSDNFLLKLKTSPFADKSTLSAEYFETYNQVKNLPEEELKVMLAMQYQHNSKLEKRLDNVLGIAFQKPSFISYVEKANMVSNNPGGISQSVDTNNGSLQAILTGRDASHINQGISPAPAESLSKWQVVELLDYIFETISDTDLPSNITEDVKSYAKLAKREAENSEPNKSRILSNLEGAIHLLNNMNDATDEAKEMIDKIKEPIIKLAGWLGVATSIFFG